MKLRDLLSILQTMEPDATVTIGVLTVGHIEETSASPTPSRSGRGRRL